jgi:carbonic anhydrase
VTKAYRAGSHDEILKRLKAGNARYRAGQPQHPRQTAERRREMALVQEPIAAVLGCADSRVPPELIFDEGLGDLFVVRVAGNFVSPNVLGSLEFGVEALGVRLIVVLGHDLCAAVAASLMAVSPVAELPGPLRDLSHSAWLHSGPGPLANVASVVEAIAPGIRDGQLPGREAFDAAIDANVRFAVEQLRNSRLIGARVARGEVAVVGARYRLESGAVEFTDSNG